MIPNVEPEYCEDLRSPDQSGELRSGGYLTLPIHETPVARVSVHKVLPGGEIASHHHSASWDFFLPQGGVGIVETISEGGIENTYSLSDKSFLAVPPRVVHRVRNLSTTTAFTFVLVQTPFSQFDFVPQSLLMTPK